MSGLLAGAVGLIVKVTLASRLLPIPLLLMSLVLVFGVYAWSLLIAMGQKDTYMALLKDAYR
jgi:hypothetical protein